MGFFGGFRITSKGNIKPYGGYHASGNITEDLYTKKSIKKLVETVDKLYYL